MLPIGDVLPYTKNPRKNDRAVPVVARSIELYGWQQPIVIDEHNVVVVGHTRLKAAQKLGLAEVPCVYAKKDGQWLTEAQCRAYRLADNRSNEYASWIDDDVAAELEQLRIEIPNIPLPELTAFTESEIKNLLDTEVEGENDAPAVRETDIKRGDIFTLGNHVLMCGDSTDDADVGQILAGQKAVMCFTDPPWNVAIGKDSNPRHRQREGLENDDMSSEDFRSFLNRYAALAAKYTSGDLYSVLGASEWPTLDSCLREYGWHWSATIIWVKDIFVLGRSKYHRRYEPLWYGWHKSGASSFNNESRDLDDVWEIKRPRVSEAHPTMKPVELCERAIINSSNRGDIVLDLFLGAGSTLIAAEKTGRACYGMEISPEYCQVIIDRYTKFTGRDDVKKIKG
jgi:DNA modification methylase